MDKSIIMSLITLAAVIIGIVIGFWFGTMQNAALIENKKKYENGKLKNGLFIMSGSINRVAMLLILLVAIQLTLPMFFQGNIQWIISAGIVLGYGWTFVKQLRSRATYHS